MNDDQDLRELFGAARREDSAGAPAFRELLRRRKGTTGAVSPVRLARPILATLVIVLAVSAVYLWKAAPAPSAPAQALLSGASWDGPTDFLLETPGKELLRSTPRIGAPIEVAPIEPKKGNRT